MFPDNWFQDNNPADIVAKVAEITLAEISTWTNDELIRVGWADNYIIERLYDLGNTGIWIARTAGTNGIEREIAAEIAGVTEAVALSTAELELLTACIDNNRLKTVEVA